MFSLSVASKFTFLSEVTTSSIGNLLAFVLCDLPDGNIDGRLKITW